MLTSTYDSCVGEWSIAAPISLLNATFSQCIVSLTITDEHDVISRASWDCYICCMICSMHECQLSFAIVILYLVPP